MKRIKVGRLYRTPQGQCVVLCRIYYKWLQFADIATGEIFRMWGPSFKGYQFLSRLTDCGVTVRPKAGKS